MTISTAQSNAVVVVGLGNIGSHVVPHLARAHEVGRLVLVDPDRYEGGNRTSQSIGSTDVGMAKTVIQAGIVRGIAVELPVETWAERVEALPLGALRAGVLLSCVDSRATRQYLNDVTRHLGVPWIDAGVEPDSGLVRITGYAPGRDAPCLECRWDQRDYDTLPQRYACHGIDGGPSTDAPSSIGALAAALQVLECQKLLAGRLAETILGTEVVLAAPTHVVHRTALTRRPTCRLEHRPPWDVQPLVGDVGTLTLDHVWARVAVGRLAVRVPPHLWATRLVCDRCRHAVDGPRLRRAGADPIGPCPVCDGHLHASGLDLTEALVPADLVPAGRARTLEQLGLRPQEILALGEGDGVRHVQVGVGARAGLQTDREEEGDA